MKKGIIRLGSNVYQAIDFAEFNFLVINRMVNRNSVRNIKNSMKEFGNTSTGLVALVDGILYVLDGQHRLTACKELCDEGVEMPFDFKLIEMDSLDDVIKFVSRINSSAKNWSTNDYIRGYAKGGNQEYINFITLTEMAKYSVEVPVEREGKSHTRLYTKKIGQSVMLLLLGQSNNNVKEGTLVVGDIEEKTKTVKYFMDLASVINPTSAQTQRAVARIVTHNKYEHKSMLEVVTNSKGTWANTEETKLNNQLKRALIITKINL